jgi:hypothetical protein
VSDLREPWRDPAGIERIGNEWGFNSFTAQQGAEQAARNLGRPGSTWFIWRLADGTYDFTSTGEPDLPGHPAELVRRIDIPRRGQR